MDSFQGKIPWSPDVLMFASHIFQELNASQGQEFLMQPLPI